MNDLPGRLVFSDVAAHPDRLPWLPMREGVEICRLYGDGPSGPGAALLRYAPGGTVPGHAHVGHEQIYVLSGSQRDQRGSYGPGTLIINPPGSGHTVTSPDGCLVLVTWERGTSLLQGDSTS